MSTPKWRKARRRPAILEYREPSGENYRYRGDESYAGEWVRTLNGLVFAQCGIDYVMRGPKGELYPISKEIFEETYEVVEP